jgi:nitroimidazol reductase NimA-like FMN-containing flavoprotein (pyridoxamine 5'-phosphate oxidase superfamily)
MTSRAPSLTVRRLRDRQNEDPDVFAEILRTGVVAHVALVRDGWPVVLPFAYGVGDLGQGPRMFLHGSTGGGLFLDAGDEGVPVCATVTHLDGLVFARSLFDSSMNYRSAMIAGRARPVAPELAEDALWIVGEHLMPGRRAEIRGNNAKERAATRVLELPLEHYSVKIRATGASEAADDGEDRTVWAGVLPLTIHAGDPLSSPSAMSLDVPQSVRDRAGRFA